MTSYCQTLLRFVQRLPFSRNRDRLLDHDVTAKFFDAVVAQARAAHLMTEQTALPRSWCLVQS